MMDVIGELLQCINVFECILLQCHFFTSSNLGICGVQETLSQNLWCFAKETANTEHCPARLLRSTSCAPISSCHEGQYVPKMSSCLVNQGQIWTYFECILPQCDFFLIKSGIRWCTRKLIKKPLVFCKGDSNAEEFPIKLLRNISCTSSFSCRKG